MSKRTTVTLMSKTEYPIETVYSQWFQSRKTTDQKVPMPYDVYRRIIKERAGLADRILKHGEPYREKGEFETEVEQVFTDVITMKMPLGETLDFVFLIENLPVALREQLVRHRIGHKFGDQMGADILVSEVANNSTFWSQTTRIVDMGSFATNGEYLTPQWLEEHGDTIMKDRRIGGITDLLRRVAGNLDGYRHKLLLAEVEQAIKDGEELAESSSTTIADFYRKQMLWIQAAYRRLVDAGMPLEDARNVLPVAMMHRFSWKTNLSSLMHVLSRRGCWLAQLGMWEPVITDIVEELATKVHPTFRRLIDPPCFNEKGDFTTCAFKRENDEIVGQPDGTFKGEYPPCSLWVNNNHYDEHRMHVIAKFSGDKLKHELACVGESRLSRYNKMQEKYAQLWGRDPKTGERKQLA